jgi:hypothetical protein
MEKVRMALREVCPYRRSQSGGCHFRFHRLAVGSVVGRVVVVVLSRCLWRQRRQQQVEGEGLIGWNDSLFVLRESVCVIVFHEVCV